MVCPHGQGLLVLSWFCADVFYGRPLTHFLHLLFYIFRQITWNTVPLALPLRNPLLAADNLCRRHYDLTRYRLQEKLDRKNKTSSSTNVDDFPPLGPEGQSVRCEQPRSLEKSPGSRQAGLAASRTSKRSKKKSLNAVDLAHTPESADMQRNGIMSDEDLHHVSLTETSAQVTVITPTTSEEWLSQVRN